MTKGPTTAMAMRGHARETEAEGHTGRLTPWGVRPTRVPPVARPVPAIVAAGGAALGRDSLRAIVKSRFPLNIGGLKFCNVAS